MSHEREPLLTSASNCQSKSTSLPSSPLRDIASILEVSENSTAIEAAENRKIKNEENMDSGVFQRFKSSKYLLIVVLGIAVVGGIGASIIGLIVSGGIPADHKPAVVTTTVKPDNGTNSTHHNMLLVISLDGFRASYLDKKLSPTIQSLIDSGVSAPFMYPSFPSKTFPNHYTIMTGLYPESHGIVDNYMFDPTITPEADRTFWLGSKSSFNPQWWGGEPFWNTVQKVGLLSATYFWPGSEVAIGNRHPNIWFPFSSSVPFEERVRTVVDLMQLETHERPSFYTLYFNEPDHTAHTFGPDSKEVEVAIKRVDDQIALMLQLLDKHELREHVNIVIVSDHGMAELERNSSMVLNEFVDTAGMFVADGAIGRIMMEKSNLTVPEVKSKLSCVDERYQVYDQQDTPRRLHFRKNKRIGQILISPKPGRTVAKKKQSTNMGDHGFDIRYPEMHAIFVANGPDFKSGGAKIEPFENIELYELMADLLAVDDKVRAPNNGTRGLLRSTLRHDFPIRTVEPEPMNSASINTLPACPFTNFETCAFDHEQCDDNPEPESNCKSLDIYVTGQNQSECSITECSTLIGWSNTLQAPRFVQSLVSLDDPSQFNVSEDCLKIATNSEINCREFESMEVTLHIQGLALVSLASNSGAWNWLTSYTIGLVENKGRLLVISGPVFDYDNDGLADSDQSILDKRSSGQKGPSDIYFIIVTCKNGFTANESCAEANVLSFVLPNLQQSTFQCLEPKDYLTDNMVRVRDIEELTGLRFFTDRNVWSSETALLLRNRFHFELW